MREVLWNAVSVTGCLAPGTGPSSFNICTVPKHPSGRLHPVRNRPCCCRCCGASAVYKYTTPYLPFFQTAFSFLPTADAYSRVYELCHVRVAHVRESVAVRMYTLALYLLGSSTWGHLVGQACPAYRILLALQSSKNRIFTLNTESLSHFHRNLLTNCCYLAAATPNKPNNVFKQLMCHAYEYRYTLEKKWTISPDSKVLRFQLPEDVLKEHKQELWNTYRWCSTCLPEGPLSILKA